MIGESASLVPLRYYSLLRFPPGLSRRYIRSGALSRAADSIHTHVALDGKSPSFLHHSTSFATSACGEIYDKHRKARTRPRWTWLLLLPPHDLTMSLTITRPFTISTYDPPSTPIAIAAQQSGQNPSRGGTRGELGPSIRKSTPSDTDNVWGNLRRTEATPPVRNKSESIQGGARLTLVLPWVHDIVTEGYVPPEGMFGPYDSSE